MTAILSRTPGGGQRAPGSACNLTPKDAQRKRQQLQQRHSTYPTQTTANFTACRRASKLPLASNSLSSSSRPCRSLPSRLDSYDIAPIAPTDPDYITRLWHDVMRGKRGAGGARRGGSFIPTRSKGNTTAEAPPTETSLSEVDTSVSKGARVTLKDFVTASILTKKKFPLNIWLKPFKNVVQRIQKQYSLMDIDQCLESEFQAFALEAIFCSVPLEEIRTLDITIKPVRVLQRVPERPSKGSEPLPNSFLAPPRQDPSGKQYDWDIRPDCAYYISLEAFDEGERERVSMYYPTVYKRAFCSYLSIEFKKDNQDLRTAKNQIAIASSMSLYNRWCMKYNMLKLLNKHDNWPKEDRDQLRHYCITLAGSQWRVWCTTPKTYEDWSGCTVSHVACGNCCSFQNLVLLFTIVNDIHYWGLTVHAESCVADVSVISRGGPSGRITCGPEEIQILVDKLNGKAEEKSGKGNAVQKADDQSKE
ncbi:hypothetical protein O1611_g5551 [Lasiodiplodia mahajangana]|uniref:Uncharacterized protein n=1 Tax=Lasiodiplodia mahajangana TaxID=1108764 RepID=A0ACC2JKU9_9PEZI|nr:hypothetical protein O1611_g5551 [Lasiodiplodia mahajangana]